MGKLEKQEIQALTLNEQENVGVVVENQGFQINGQLLELILEREVESFKVGEGSSPGDNYMSDMHAIEVHYRGLVQPEHIVIKCYPNNAERREFLDQIDVFAKEFFFYDEWAPKLQELGQSLQIGISIPKFLGGNCKGNGRSKTRATKFPAPWTNENFIVMSDLRREGGLRMADRIEGLDAKHVLLVMKELATLHALSWCFKVTSGADNLTSVYPQLEDKMYSTVMESTFKPVLDGVMKTSLTHVEAALGPHSPVYKGLQRLFTLDTLSILRHFVSVQGINETEMEKLLRIRDKDSKNFVEEPWLVGCHGDGWVNNMLFSYDDQGATPTEVVMVDFQMYREGCLTTDLAYFFYTSTTHATRKEHENFFLKTYCDQFTAVCEALDCKPLPGFSLPTLKRRYRRAKIFGIFLGVLVLTLVLKPPEDAPKFDDLSGNVTEMFNSATQTGPEDTKFKNRILEIAHEFYEEGIF